LILYGSEQQKQQWLPALLSAEMIGGHAITEHQAGSDINTIETHAVPTDSGFILNGHKRFITNTPAGTFEGVLRSQHRVYDGRGEVART
jgi:alkylation response protein AidB-like acyl-CoA dehydrogenase